MDSKQKSKYRQSKQWKEFRKQIIAERDSRCEICGIQKSGKSKRTLQLHHLDPSDYGSETRDSVVLLCSSDHKLIERLLSRTKNKVDITAYIANLKEVFNKSQLS